MRKTMLIRRVTIVSILLFSIYFLIYSFVVLNRTTVHNVASFSERNCNLRNTCPKGHLYLWMTPASKRKMPSICINNKRIFQESQSIEGIHIALLNEKTFDIEDTKYFSVSHENFPLINYLNEVTKNKIIVAITFGDIALGISKDIKRVFSLFGSSVLDGIKSGHSFFFLGKYGLSPINTLEKVVPIEETASSSFATCIDLAPFNSVIRSTFMNGETNRLASNRVANVNFGKEVENCGLIAPCPQGQMAMSFYSGKNKDDYPRICVDGRIVIDREVNYGGRGLNVVVIDPDTHSVVRAGRFDTYETGSDDLVVFLELLSPGEIVAVVSSDEASNKLSDTAKSIFYELGSSLIGYIKFRSSWYFVGQKGIHGYSSFEDLISPSGNDWAKSINKEVCVPYDLNGLESTKRSLEENSQRRHFCLRYDGFEDFCNEKNVEKPLVPRIAFNSSLHSNPVFSVPILFVGGLYSNNVRLCLESIYNLEGVNLDKILVAFDSSSTDLPDLLKLFHVRALAISNTTSYEDLFVDALNFTISYMRKEPVFIVIKEDFLLLEDFLHFFAQLMPQFLKDDTAGLILAWNENGFLKTSSLSSVVYRIESFHLAGAFMIKRSILEEHLNSIVQRCCDKDEEWNWAVKTIAYVPDVSRVRSTASNILTDPNEASFDKNEILSFNVNISTRLISNADRLGESDYDSDQKNLIKFAKNTYLTEKMDCDFISSKIYTLSNVRQTSAFIYNEQSTTLDSICFCFSLVCENGTAFGFYKGMLRFSFAEEMIFIISDKSIFNPVAKNR